MYIWLHTKSLVTHLDPNGIEEHQRLTDIQRPILPFRHLVQYCAGDRRDQVRGNLDAFEFIKLARLSWRVIGA